MSTEPQRQADQQPTDQVTCDLDQASFAEVRRLVRGMLAGRGDVAADDAVLVTDELVSNAHRHGAAPRSCRLALVDGGRRLRVEVDDASPVMPRKRTPDRTGGRGLVLVDQLATGWGVDRYDGHKTVWAEFALDPFAYRGGSAPHLAVAPDGPHSNAGRP
jgi:two-component sensor histidine kinase